MSLDNIVTRSEGKYLKPPVHRVLMDFAADSVQSIAAVTGKQIQVVSILASANAECSLKVTTDGESGDEDMELCLGSAGGFSARCDPDEDGSAILASNIGKDLTFTLVSESTVASICKARIAYVYR